MLLLLKLRSEFCLCIWQRGQICYWQTTEFLFDEKLILLLFRHILAFCPGFEHNWQEITLDYSTFTDRAERGSHNLHIGGDLSAPCSRFLQIWQTISAPKSYFNFRHSVAICPFLWHIGQLTLELLVRSFKGLRPSRTVCPCRKSVTVAVLFLFLERRLPWPVHLNFSLFFVWSLVSVLK